VEFLGLRKGLVKGDDLGELRGTEETIVEGRTRLQVVPFFLYVLLDCGREKTL